MDLRELLRDIYNRRGQLTPAIVVDEARPIEHPLHNRFEWDDRVAAEAHRREQAHQLIRLVRIEYAAPGGQTRTVREFHCARTEDGNVYHPADVITADPFLTRLVLADMEREWRAMRDRYETFAEFWKLIRSDIGD